MNIKKIFPVAMAIFGHSSLPFGEAMAAAVIFKLNRVPDEAAIVAGLALYPELGLPSMEAARAALRSEKINALQVDEILACLPRITHDHGEYRP